MRFYLLLTTVLMLLCVACSKKTSRAPGQEIVTDAEPLSRGKIMYFHGSKDTSMHYVIYVPQNPMNYKNLPLAVFFDPQGRGHHPVKQYQALADTFGWILIGSRDSRNGLTVIRNREIYAGIMAEIAHRWDIHPSRIYTCGFSGGGRIAAYLAMHDPAITGAVSCGAGLPGNTSGMPYYFSYVLIAGREDFNYTEVSRLNRQLDADHYRHGFFLFNGPHQWPKPDRMQAAFTWLELDAMRRGIIPKHEALIQKVIKQYQEQILKAKDSGQKYELYNQLESSLDQLMDIRNFKNDFSVTVSQNDIRLLMNQQETDDKKESSDQQEILKYFQKTDTKWLAARISVLRKQAESTSLSKASYSKRLLNYTSMLSYMYTNAALENHDLENARHYLTVYAHTDPDNYAMKYFYAVYHMKSGHTDGALLALKDADTMGFFDYIQLENEPAFKPIRHTKDFALILENARRRYEE